MQLENAGPWFVLFAYAALTWWAAPRRVTSPQFFDGREKTGAPPGILLVAFSAAITWIFAKSIANAADLSYAFGIAGGIGYTIYYLSFAVAGVAIYFLRTRGHYQSLTHFLVEKYGSLCARLFLLTISFRPSHKISSRAMVVKHICGSSSAHNLAI